MVLLLFLLLCMSSPAYAVNFVEILRNENDLIYLDLDSVSQRSSLGRDYIVAWVKWIPRGDKLKEQSKLYKTNSLDYIIRLSAFDKNLKQVQVLAFSAYDKKGNVIASNSWQFSPSDYSEIAPQTYGDWIYDIVMFNYNLKNERNN